MFHEPLFVLLEETLTLVEIALGLIVILSIFQDVLITLFVVSTTMKFLSNSIFIVKITQQILFNQRGNELF